MFERRKFIVHKFMSSLNRNMRNQKKPPLAVFCQDEVSKSIFIEGQYEAAELACVINHVLPNIPQKSLFLDIGANVGNHTAALAPFFDNVIAFEPNPRTALLLRANSMLFDNVESRTYGLSDQEATVKTSYDDYNVGGASVYSGDNNKNKAIFELKRLDDELTDDEMASVSLIKIDVEGHELEVLKGATRTLEESSPLILFEINKSEVKQGRNKTKDFLEQCGYSYFYYLKDNAPLVDLSTRLAKFISSLSVLLFSRKLRGKLKPSLLDGKLKNQKYSLIVASKTQLSET